MQYINIKELYRLIDDYDNSTALLRKQAFVPGAGAPPPQAPPMDPSMMGGGGAPPMPPGGGAMPPMDPSMMGGAPGMPPGGGMPPGAPPMDPSMMGGAPGMPPMDPSMMGGAPPADPSMMGMPPGGDPNAQGGQGGGIQPEVESALADLAGGMDQLAQTAEAQQQQTDQLSKRMLDVEQKMDQKAQEDKMKESAPFEGSTKTQQDVSLESIAQGV